MGMIKNMPQVLQGVDLKITRARALPTKIFRAFVWDVFLSILRESPQYSGKGVANWNLSVNAPDFEFRDDFGDDDAGIDKNFSPITVAPHKKGDSKWMIKARNRARPIKNAITSKDKVFISNGTRGDGDEVGAELYMQALQNEGYWAYKLREVNKPYITAQDSLVIVAMKYAQKGFFAPRVGGASWETE